MQTLYLFSSRLVKFRSVTSRIRGKFEVQKQAGRKVICFPPMNQMAGFFFSGRGVRVGTKGFRISHTKGIVEVNKWREVLAWKTVSVKVLNIRRAIMIKGEFALKEELRGLEEKMFEKMDAEHRVFYGIWYLRSVAACHLLLFIN